MAIDLILYASFYLFGSIPFSVIVGRLFFKTDVRQFGSGNPGATNTMRILGPKAGIVVLLLDVFKGLFPVIICKYYCTWPDIPVSDRMVLAGALAILGHVFSPFLGFKGGKGVATSIGVVMALEPWFAIAIIATFIIVLALSRYVSLSSISAAFVFTILTLLFRNEDYIKIIFSISITILIVIKHQANILRLLKGKENRFVFRK
jgi:glycerol-3-phosphate acyltransferase PlsY